MAVTRPVLTTVLVAAVLVLGAFSYTRLVVDLFPEIDFPFVTVTTIYPGAGPEEVESQISERIEDAVSTIAGIKRMDSINRESLSMVLIEFELGVDGDQAGIDTKEKVEQILNELPQDAETPQVVKFELGALPILNLALTGPQSLRELYEVADNMVRDAISQAPGVASVTIIGGRKREIRVALDPDQLVAHALDAASVVAAISAENVSVPAGHVTEASGEMSIRVLGEFTDLEELRRLPVRTPGGGIVEVSDLGRVVDTTEEARDQAELDGVASVGLFVQKRTDANTVSTARGVREEIEELATILPAGMKIDVVRDNSTFIQTAVRDVLVNIAIGILLTTILLYLFLHSMRTTVIAAVAMPTSIIATFLLIDFGGFSINIVSLLGLGISIGVLVTNAIVVLESISRHVDVLGEDPKTAARAGTDEVMVAVAATAMTNVVVFTPIAFMGGVIGQWFDRGVRDTFLSACELHADTDDGGQASQVEVRAGTGRADGRWPCGSPGGATASARAGMGKRIPKDRGEIHRRPGVELATPLADDRGRSRGVRVGDLDVWVRRGRVLPRVGQRIPPGDPQSPGGHDPRTNCVAPGRGRSDRPSRGAGGGVDSAHGWWGGQRCGGRRPPGAAHAGGRSRSRRVSDYERVA
jgi:HAE1 family hydrophobic/amphiphilic exporter-1